MRKEIVLVSCIILFFAAVVAAVLQHGRAHRLFAAPDHRTAFRHIDAPDLALRIWESHGVKGRTLVLFDRHLNASPERDDAAGAPPPTPDNYLYVAFRRNIVRKVYHVIPDASWPEVERNLRNIGSVPDAAGRYRLTIEGTPVMIMTISALPAIEETVLVSISRVVWGGELRRIGSLFRYGLLNSDLISIAGGSAALTHDESALFGTNME